MQDAITGWYGWQTSLAPFTSCETVAPHPEG